jgi:hypothetical protein
VARVGMGPILRIGKNQKAPTIQRPPNRSNNDATFIVLQERDDFCGVRVVPIGKLFEKNTAVGNVVTAECPLSGEQRKTFARFEFFRL